MKNVHPSIRGFFSFCFIDQRENISYSLRCMYNIQRTNKKNNKTKLWSTDMRYYNI